MEHRYHVLWLSNDDPSRNKEYVGAMCDRAALHTLVLLAHLPRSLTRPDAGAQKALDYVRILLQYPH